MDENGEPDLREIQLVELGILLEFDRVCKALELPYILCFGTLLGAVRHKGFIPWDDDVDVVMLRDDYERFLREAPALVKVPYFLQTIDTEPEYPFAFAKLRDSSTTFIEKMTVGRRINHGVFIDVFPFDGVPESYPVRRLGWYLLSAVGRVGFLKAFDSRSVPRSDIERMIAKLIPLSDRRVMRLYSRLISLKGSGKAKHVAHSVYPTIPMRRFVYPKKWVEDSIDMEFEGHMFPVPRNYDGILSMVYGDYMTPPPEEHRIAHHPMCGKSVSISYTDFINRSLPQAERKDLTTQDDDQERSGDR